jgi:hypothetical protein
MLGYIWVPVAILTSAVPIVTAVILVRRFLRTRETGFIWLGVATLIWPLASVLLKNGVMHLINWDGYGHSIGMFPFTLVERGYATYGEILASFNYTQALVGAVLLLIAVMQLSRPNHVSPDTTLVLH